MLYNLFTFRGLLTSRALRKTLSLSLSLYLFLLQRCCARSFGISGHSPFNMAANPPPPSQHADRDVELLLQVPGVHLDEITGWSRRLVMQSVDLNVVSIVPTQLEVDHAVAQYQLNGSALQPGKPLVFIICGEYKIPLLPSMATTRAGPYDYVFAVPNLSLGIRLAGATPKEVVEAFEWVVKTYGTLREGPTPPHEAGAAPGGAAAAYAPPSAPAQPTTVSSAYATPGRPYQPQWGNAASYAVSYAPPQGAAGGAMSVQPGGGYDERTSTKVARGIGTVAGYVTTGFVVGSQFVARGITSGSTHVVQNTAACEKPVEVPPIIANNIHRSRVASKGAVVVTSALAGVMMGIAGVVSDQVSSRLRSAPDPNSPPESEAVSGLKEVGVAAAGAGVALFDAATTAARTLLTATSEGVQRVVTHKMGDEAGAVAGDATGLLQDGFTVATNVQSSGLKGLAAQTLKQSAEKTFKDPPPSV